MKLYLREEAPDGSGPFLRPLTRDAEPEFERPEAQVNFKDSEHGYTGPIMRISGPVSYYIASLVVHFVERPHELLCVDAGGRNFGLSGPVFAKLEDVIAEVERWRPGFWKEVVLLYTVYQMNPSDLKPLIWKKLGFQEHEDLPPQLRLLVCGQREFAVVEPIERLLADLRALVGTGRAIQVIHGAALGADTLGALVAKQMFGDENVLAFPANWNLYGKAAGVIRNSLMLDQGPHLVAAFYVKNGSLHSRGTNDTVRKAEAKGIPVLKYEYSVGWW